MDIFPFPALPAPADLHRETAIALLTEARSTLRMTQGCNPGGSPFICDNLHYAAVRQSKTLNYRKNCQVDETLVAMRRWIRRMDGERWCFLDWMTAEGHLAQPDREGLYPDDVWSKIQRTRLAWIDWMIKELEQ